MPSSNVNLVPTIVSLIFGCKPRRVLDVGPGRGKYGLLTREYCSQWLERLDACEAWGGYVTPILTAIYDHIRTGDVLGVSANVLADYDLVLMLDVIEHLEKDAGLALLRRCPQRVIVATPMEFFQNPEADAIPPERHRSLWTKADFGDRIENDQSAFGGIVLLLKPQG